MAKRGPKPKPTALHIFNGNPSKRPLNDLEPKPEAGAPECPENVAKNDIAKAYWEWLIAQLSTMGIATKADQTVLEMICLEYALKLEAEGHIARDGMTTTDDKGVVRKSPYVTIAAEAKRQLHRLLTEVGLTPSSRSRLKVEPGEVKGSIESYALSRNG
jgi:P27 family predicted phage terminase small subunit